MKGLFRKGRESRHKGKHVAREPRTTSSLLPIPPVPVMPRTAKAIDKSGKRFFRRHPRAGAAAAVVVTVVGVIVGIVGFYYAWKVASSKLVTPADEQVRASRNLSPSDNSTSATELPLVRPVEMSAPSPTPVASIRRPVAGADGQRVGYEDTVLECEYHNLPDGYEIWATVRRPNSDLLFRQGPLQRDRDNRCHGNVFLGIGGTQELGKVFRVSLFAVPGKLAEEWKAEYAAVKAHGGAYLSAVTLDWLTSKGADPLTTEEFVLANAN